MVFLRVAVLHRFYCSETCLKPPHKIDKTKVLKIGDSLLQVESIGECSIGAFCNTFDLHKTIISLENVF